MSEVLQQESKEDKDNEKKAFFETEAKIKSMEFLFSYRENGTINENEMSVNISLIAPFDTLDKLQFSEFDKNSKYKIEIHSTEE